MIVSKKKIDICLTFDSINLEHVNSLEHCMYVLYACVHVCACACMCVGGLEVDVRCLHYCSPAHFLFETGLSVNLDFTYSD